jgi:hypothetical protein
LDRDRRRFAGECLGEAALGDRRLRERGVRILERMAAAPSASIPKQMGAWKDTKAAYRFFDHRAVTFEAVTTSHQQQTRDRARREPVVLCIEDTTAISFDPNLEIEGLGPLGTGATPGLGLWVHSVLAVAPDDEPRVLGLAHQHAWVRVPKPRGETRMQRLEREKESDRWSRAVQETGRLAQRTVYVGDRESDIFELFATCVARGCDWLVRSAGEARNRRVFAGDVADADGPERLLEVARRQEAVAEYHLSLRARPGQAAREVQMRVSAVAVRVLPPSLQSKEQEARNGPLKMWLVRAWEAGHAFGGDNAADKKKIEWLLLTSVPADTAEKARRAVEWYSRRWLIEEYHKCLKTGCAVQQRQLEHVDRLLPLIGMLGLTAVWLLQLKELGRRGEQARATDVVPEIYVRVLAALRQEPVSRYTAHHFWREVAKLGGFLARKGDGDPGWITLWRGWCDLELMVRGASAVLQPRSYG